MVVEATIEEEGVGGAGGPAVQPAAEARLRSNCRQTVGSDRRRGLELLGGLGRAGWRVGCRRSSCQPWWWRQWGR